MRSATLRAFVDWRPSAVNSTILVLLVAFLWDAPRAASARVPGLPLRSIGYEQRCAAVPSVAGRPPPRNGPAPAFGGRLHAKPVAVVVSRPRAYDASGRTF